MTHDTTPFRRRTVLKTLGALGTIGGVSGVASARRNGSSARLELVGHTTLGARDGGNTYGAVREDLDLAAVGSFYMGGNELRLVDIEQPDDPRLVSTIGTDPAGVSSDIRNVDIHPSEPWVLVGNEGGEDAGWAIVDVSDRHDPDLFGPFTVEDAPSGAHNVLGFKDDYAIAVGHGRGMVAYDISDPANPVEVSQFQMPAAEHDDGHDHEGEGETIHAAHARGDHVFLAHWNRGMYVLDMSDPADPTVAASFDYTEEDADVPLRSCHHATPHPSKDLCLLGEEVGHDLPGYKHAVSFDLDTGETELLSSFQFPQHAQQNSNQGYWWTGHFSDWGVGDQEDVVFSGDYKAGVQVFDLSDPADPDRIDQYMPTEGVGEVRDADPERLDLIDNVPFTWSAESSMAGDSGYVYVSDITTGFYVLSLEGY